MGSSASIKKKKKGCQCCHQKLKLLRYCTNQECIYYLSEEEIEEHQWNDWMVYSYSEPGDVIDNSFNQVFPD